MTFIKGAAALLSGIAIFGATASISLADHSWGGFHWARTANPFTLKVGDNVTKNWDKYLATAVTDWSLSTVLDISIVPGLSNRNCRPTAGRIEVCNNRYGANGWLGLASVWTSNEHITQGTVKLNDTYFNTATYNTVAWKNLVMCQEIAHVFGLDHQDEDFYNAPLGTCMDYSADPTQNQHPNAHDYEQIETIYAHLDGFTTLAQTSTVQNGSKATVEEGFDVLEDNFGKEIRRSRDGRTSVFERDLGEGKKVTTFVTWAKEKKDK